MLSKFDKDFDTYDKLFGFVKDVVALFVAVFFTLLIFVVLVLLIVVIIQGSRGLLHGLLASRVFLTLGHGHLLLLFSHDLVHDLLRTALDGRRA